MAADTKEAVDQLLGDLASTLDAEDPEDAEDAGPDPDELSALADRADELVSTTALTDLLHATGLGGEDSPASIPAAVAAGDPENVARLRGVLTLSKLSTADGDRAADLVDELRSLAERFDEEPAAPTSIEADDEAVDEPTGDIGVEGDTETATDEETATEDGAEEAAEDESESPLRGLLESQIDEIQGLLGRDSEDEGVVDTLGEESDDAETDDRSETESPRSGDGTRFRPRGATRGTTHATIPATGRREIGRAGRFSSMRVSTIPRWSER